MCIHRIRLRSIEGGSNCPISSRLVEGANTYIESHEFERYRACLGPRSEWDQWKSTSDNLSFLEPFPLDEFNRLFPQRPGPENVCWPWIEEDPEWAEHPHHKGQKAKSSSLERAEANENYLMGLLSKHMRDEPPFETLSSYTEWPDDFDGLESVSSLRWMISPLNCCRRWEDDSMHDGLRSGRSVKRMTPTFCDANPTHTDSAHWQRVQHQQRACSRPKL